MSSTRPRTSEPIVETTVPLPIQVQDGGRNTLRLRRRTAVLATIVGACALGVPATSAAYGAQADYVATTVVSVSPDPVGNGDAAVADCRTTGSVRSGRGRETRWRIRALRSGRRHAPSARRVDLGDSDRNDKLGPGLCHGTLAGISRPGRQRSSRRIPNPTARRLESGVPATSRGATATARSTPPLSSRRSAASR